MRTPRHPRLRLQPCTLTRRFSFEQLQITLVYKSWPDQCCGPGATGAYVQVDPIRSAQPRYCLLLPWPRYEPEGHQCLAQIFREQLQLGKSLLPHIGVSLRSHTKFFDGRWVDIHASRDDLFDEVHRPSECHASRSFSFLTPTLVQNVYTGFSKHEDRAKAEAFFKVGSHHEFMTLPVNSACRLSSGQGYWQVQPSPGTGT